MDVRILLPALIGAQILLCGAASLGGESQEPPLSPEGETVMDDPDTAAYCLAHARDVGAQLDEAPDTAGYFRWTLGEVLVSHNPVWGILCRIDFTMAGQDVSPRVNRLVVYAAARKINVMIAIGQDLAPLDAQPAPYSSP